MSSPLLLGQSGIAQTPVSDPPTQIPKDDKYLFGAQATFILQYLSPFRSPYEGKNSLQSIAQARISDTYTLFLGDRITKGLELYLNPEMARGGGVSNALGLAGYTNGDVIRNPTLGQDPYLARLFLRWTIQTGSGLEKVDRGENQIAGSQPTHRLVITGGKLGTNDIFDLNRYADSTRTQFMNWALINSAAYDYAADTRGYSIGFAAEWYQPGWVFRLGSFEMPTVANGIDLDPKISDNRGDQAEFEIHPKLLKGKDTAVVRFLAYRNLAKMGDYAESIDLAGRMGGVPDITATRAPGRSRFGGGINFEQPLADDGETGVFGRLAWSDGATESFAYTECDNQISLGAQLSGKRWRSPKDELGLAVVSEGLSGAHEEYLEKGGSGFILGDGGLNYGREDLFEVYYQRRLNPYTTVSLDFQGVANPGYNMDRGPVPVLSARVHLEF